MFGKILAAIINPKYLVLSSIKWCLSGSFITLLWTLPEGGKSLGSDCVLLAKANPPDLMEFFE